jgi:hypothetical protein
MARRDPDAEAYLKTLRKDPAADAYFETYKSKKESRIAPQTEEYQYGWAALDKVIKVLDYTSNVGRSWVEGALNPEKSWEEVKKQGMDSFTYDHVTGTQNLKNTLRDRIGYEAKGTSMEDVAQDAASALLSQKGKTGEVADIVDNPVNYAEDTYDFIADVITDSAVDPLTYLTLGASAVVRLVGGAGTKAGKAAFKQGAKEAGEGLIQKTVKESTEGYKKGLSKELKGIEGRLIGTEKQFDDAIDKAINVQDTQLKRIEAKRNELGLPASDPKYVRAKEIVMGRQIKRVRDLEDLKQVRTAPLKTRREALEKSWKNVPEEVTEGFVKEATEKFKNVPDDELIGMARQQDAFLPGALKRRAEAGLDVYNKYGQIGKDLGTGLLAGSYNVAANIEKEDDIADAIGLFGVGFAAGAGGRRAMRSRVARQAMDKVGNAVNKLVQPRKQAAALMKNSATGALKPLKLDVPTHKLMTAAVAAGDKARIIKSDLRRVINPTLKQLRTEDPVALAIATDAQRTFRDLVVADRSKFFADDLAELNKYELDRMKLTKDSTYADATHPEARALRDLADNKARSKWFDRAGNVRPSAWQEWKGLNEIQITNNVSKAHEALAKAGNELWETERKHILKSLEEIDPAQAEIMKSRVKAYDELSPEEKSVYRLDMLNDDAINASYDLAIKNKGLPIFSPIRYAKDTGIAQTALSKEAAKKAGPKLKAAVAGSKQTDREFLSEVESISKDELARMQQIDRIRGKDADQLDEYLDSYEAAINQSIDAKANNALNTIDKEALGYAGDYLNSRSLLNNSFTKTLDLHKKMMLLGSHPWVVNNYWSNIMQSATARGLWGAIDSATGVIPALSKAQKEIWDIHKQANWHLPDAIKRGKDPTKLKNWYVRSTKNILFDPKNSRIREAFDEGIIDAPRMKDFLDDIEAYGRFKWAGDVLERRIGDKKGFLQRADRATDTISELIGTNKLARIVEDSSRFKTYFALKNSLGKTMGRDVAAQAGEEVAEDMIKRLAKDMTNDIFFDYGKLSYAERALVRRFVPFYSFLKQNLRYQLGAAFDIDKASKLGTAGRIATGKYFDAERMSGEEAHSMSPFLAAAGAFRKKNPRTDTISYMHSNANPLHAAIQLLNVGGRNWSYEVLSNLNPLLITEAIVQLSGYDPNVGRSLDPNANNLGGVENKVKYLHSRGYSTKAIWDVIDNAIQKSPTIFLDDKGNPVTDNVFAIRVHRLMHLLVPIISSPVQTVAGPIRSYQEKKLEPWEIAANIASPFKVTKQIPELDARNIDEYRREQKIKHDMAKESAAYRVRNKYGVAKREQRGLAKRLQDYFKGEKDETWKSYTEGIRSLIGHPSTSEKQKEAYEKLLDQIKQESALP